MHTIARGQDNDERSYIVFNVSKVQELTVRGGVVIGLSSYSYANILIKHYSD